jgi:3-methyladenine DNA glycosylase AlkD
VAADRQLIAALRAELAARADPAKAEGMRGYMKSALPFYGVQKPGRTEIARSLFAAHPLAGSGDWRDTVLALWRGATRREERYLAIALLNDPRYRAHRTIDALPVYEELIVSGAWWDFVDEVAAFSIGELLGRDGAALAPALSAWARDGDLWRRRAAIVCQVRRKADTDLALLYDCIEPNRGDREFFIRKGIGWALRSYAWVDPDEIVRYCDSHELSPLSRREALRNIVSDTRRGAARARPALRRSAAP